MKCCLIFFSLVGVSCSAPKHVDAVSRYISLTKECYPTDGGVHPAGCDYEKFKTSRAEAMAMCQTDRSQTEALIQHMTRSVDAEVQEELLGFFYDLLGSPSMAPAIEFIYPYRKSLVGVAESNFAGVITKSKSKFFDGFCAEQFDDGKNIRVFRVILNRANYSDAKQSIPKRLILDRLRREYSASKPNKALIDTISKLSLSAHFVSGADLRNVQGKHQ